MPWATADATSHTKKANTPRLARMWRDVANAELNKHGDEARAVKAANGVVADAYRAERGR